MIQPSRWAGSTQGTDLITMDLVGLLRRIDMKMTSNLIVRPSLRPGGCLVEWRVSCHPSSEEANWDYGNEVRWTRDVPV